MGLFSPVTKATGASDPVVTVLANRDVVPWYRKRNLRYLYFMLFPTCMGIELTSGFDSQLINALQIVPSWVDCMSLFLTFCVLQNILTVTQILAIRKARSKVS